MWKIVIVFLIIATQSYASIDADCGQIKLKKTNELSFNGTESYHGQWPWLASIFIKTTNKYICGSSIITKWHLLTAAHCASSTNVSDFYALMGRFDLSNLNEPHGQRKDIELIKIHENYNKTKFQRSRGDIAIFKLSEEIQFNEYVQPVCLPQPSADVIGRKGFLSGYGQTEPIQLHHEDKPSFVKLKSINIWDCLEKGLIYGNVISEFSFCGGNDEAIPCRGDSGGGFYVYDRATRRYTTYGVLSYGIGQCNPNEYVVFVDVVKYIQWINEAIASENLLNEIFKLNLCAKVNCDDRSECQVNNNKAECICKSNFHGIPPNCNPKCFNNSSCPENRACINNICTDLCSIANSCVTNSKCMIFNHEIKCECKRNYQSTANDEQLCTYFIDGVMKYSEEFYYEIAEDYKSFLTFFVHEEAKLTSINSEIRPTYRKENVERIVLTPFNESYLNYLPVNVDRVFKNLKVYQVSKGSLKEVKRDNFHNLNKLEIIQIQSNEIEMTIDENSFCDLTDLRVFDFNFNGITQLPQKLFENNTKLEEIYLTGNKLTSMSNELFKNLIELKKLYLGDNQLSSLTADIFINLHKLQWLSLNGNQLKSMPENVFENLIELEAIGLSKNQLTSLHENIFSNNLKLKHIELHSNQITFLSFQIFENKSMLKCVDLKENICIDMKYGDCDSDVIIIMSQEKRELLRKDLNEKC